MFSPEFAASCPRRLISGHNAATMPTPVGRSVERRHPARAIEAAVGQCALQVLLLTGRVNHQEGTGAFVPQTIEDSVADAIAGPHERVGSDELLARIVVRLDGAEVR